MYLVPLWPKSVEVTSTSDDTLPVGAGVVEGLGRRAEVVEIRMGIGGCVELGATVGSAAWTGCVGVHGTGGCVELRTTVGWMGAASWTGTGCCGGIPGTGMGGEGDVNGSSGVEGTSN